MDRYYQLSVIMNNKLRYFMWIACLVLIVGLSACSTEDTSAPLVIAISKGKPDKYYGAYTRWLKEADSTIEVIDLYHMPLDSALALLDRCAGLLISGGPDIHPGFYGRPQDTVKCNDGIDGKRDTLELMLIGKALEQDIPILGICRGLQVINVALGGSLYADIPSDLPSDLRHRCLDKNNCNHEINVAESSELFNISQLAIGSVNSNHHQGISIIADNLVPVAKTKDGIIEAFQWEYPDNKAFLLAVQWHPERMKPENPFSLPIAAAFIMAAREAEINKHPMKTN
ncbi:MAG: gamma-glutamyl-gamma-aminobutyrate hydrolase family protein [Bacteroidota bacterium]|nr:gamma-glutamyl-gamma-aminobutyrate hydrolase family protein [Bacteroidota bacterium]